MAVGTLVRMVGRRLALRKGLAVSAAVVLLLGGAVLCLAIRNVTHSVEVTTERPVEPVS